MRIVYLLISILLVSILFLSIFYFTNRNKQDGTESKLNESFCNEIEFKPLNDVCHIAFSKDIDSCKDVGKGYDTLCYEIVVDSMNVSESICENMKNEYSKSLCNKKLAIKLKDPELCEGNFNCYIELASSNNDESVCENIEFDLLKYQCLAKVSGSRDYCDNIEEEIERMNCIGVVPEEVSDCKIEGYVNFDCLIELANKEKNSTFCNLIDLEEVMWTCIIDIENNPKVCDNAPDFFKDICRIEYLKNYLKG